MQAACGPRVCDRRLASTSGQPLAWNEAPVLSGSIIVTLLSLAWQQRLERQVCGPTVVAAWHKAAPGIHRHAREFTFGVQDVEVDTKVWIAFAVLAGAFRTVFALILLSASMPASFGCLPRRISSTIRNEQRL